MLTGAGNQPERSTVATPSTRDRLVDAALTLFAERGFEQTTVDDIVAAVGVSRMTFFRAFPTKEDVVFTEHGPLIDRVRTRLDEAGPDDWPEALSETTQMVLRHYLDEGDIARRRYRLTRTIPALRDREVAMTASYQRLFAESLHRVLPEDGTGGLWADVLAAAVVAAHNFVLRRHLRGETENPVRALDDALDDVFARLTARSAEDVRVVAVRSALPLEEVATRVRQALA